MGHDKQGRFTPVSTSLMLTEPSQFWAKTAKRPNGCWEWLGAIDRKGYGVICLRIEGRKRIKRAHQIAFFLAHGSWATYLLHSCDNAKCVNPEHLSQGTPSQNLKEAYDRNLKKPTFKTHCKRGHALSGDNVRFRGTRKVCRACDRWYHKKKTP